MKPEPPLELRSALASDLPFLRRMLEEAVMHPDAQPSAAALLDEPRIARYLVDWGREGDAGVVAVEAARPVGAAWYRLFRDDEPGFGFVAAAVPELTIAVVPERRGQGVGGALLTELIRQARRAGHPALSLSVDPANRAAVTLYRRAGFTRVPSHDEHWTMVLELTL